MYKCGKIVVYIVCLIYNIPENIKLLPVGDLIVWSNVIKCFSRTIGYIVEDSRQIWLTFVHTQFTF